MGCSTPHGLRDENLRLLASRPRRRRQRLLAGLVHLLVTHGSFGIPQTSLGGWHVVVLHRCREDLFMAHTL